MISFSWRQFRTSALIAVVALVALAVLLGSIVTVGLLSPMITWWASPIETINLNRFASIVFESNYITSIGYAAFAFALGVTFGVLFRRTLAAMATTLGAFIAFRIVFTQWLRLHLLPPVRAVTSLKDLQNFGFTLGPSGLSFMAQGESQPNSWLISSLTVGKHGATVTKQWLQVHCTALVRSAGTSSNARPNPQAFRDCVNKIGAQFHEVVTYQPASRFWTFQIFETAIYTVLALLLCAISYWWVRKRIA